MAHYQWGSLGAAEEQQLKGVKAKKPEAKETNMNFCSDTIGRKRVRPPLSSISSSCSVPKKPASSSGAACEGTSADSRLTASAGIDLYIGE